MKCPRCKQRTRVLRTSQEAGKVIRERGCKGCGYRFQTREEAARAVRVWVAS